MRKRSYELVIPITSVVNSHFFFILPFFPFTVHCRGIWNFELFIQIFSCFSILTNINLSGSLVFVGFYLVGVVFIEAYAVEQRHCRQIRKA